jgi:hypothetical protein
MLYSDEVWTGVEYQVAAHLIYEGIVEEGFCVAKGARDRYDGVPRPPIGRNPWCEIECGGHYTRAMSSWSLLLALSGFHYDGPRAALRFAPSHNSKNFKSFFSATEGWGNFQQKADGKTQKSEIAVKSSGKLRVKTLELATVSNGVTPHVEATLDGRKVTVESSLSDNYCRIRFENTGIVVEEGTTLEITMTV